MHFIDSKSVSKRAQGKPCVCKFKGCGKVISNVSNLARHYLVHSGDKPFACDKCNRRFNQRVNLSKHLRAHEDGISKDRPFRCDFPSCFRRFSNKSAYDAHLIKHNQRGNNFPYNHITVTYTSIPRCVPIPTNNDSNDQSPVFIKDEFDRNDGCSTPLPLEKSCSTALSSTDPSFDSALDYLLECDSKYTDDEWNMLTNLTILSNIRKFNVSSTNVSTLNTFQPLSKSIQS